MFLSLLAMSALATEPHASYPKLVTANGYGVAVFNAEHSSGAMVDTFSDHLYQQYQPGQESTRDLMYDSAFGIRVQGSGQWLSVANDYGMELGTGLMWADRSQGELQITEWAFAPMDLPAPALVQVLKVQNLGGEEISLSLFSLHNLHVGSASNDNESIQRRGQGLFEVGAESGLGFDMVPLSTPSHVDCSPDNPYYAVLQGWDLGECAGSTGDDRIGAMQWDHTLAPGESAWVGVVLAFSAGVGDQTAVVDAYLAGRGGEALVQAERDWWSAWHAQGSPPAGLSEPERQVYLQALAFMKMGQVREPGDAYGQILASLPLSAPVGAFQHIWNIAWVRDGAYGIRALTEAGHMQEAKDALEFQIQPGKTGEYQDYVGGMEHALSVCRIYGNGQEWSDTDQDGPNIEFDNFGLYLWAAGMYVRAAGDSGFVQSHQEQLLDKTADVLVALIEQDTGLIAADSSIWEEHWNGKQRHFTYTSTWAVAGLRMAAELAERVGDTRAQGYRSAADDLARAIRVHLVRADGVLVGNLEELQWGDPALDLAAVDAFNNGTLDPQRELFQSSYGAWDSTLRVPHGRGFMRNDDGDLYDSYEWLMIDLRVAEALRRACRYEEAAELEDWITAQAQANHLVVPELFEPNTADYGGPAPMMGFGSGLYVLQMHTRDGLGTDCEPSGVDTGTLDTGDSGGGDDSGDSGETGDSGQDPPGCGGCGVGGGSGGQLGWPLGLAGILLGLRRGRSRRRS